MALVPEWKTLMGAPLDNTQWAIGASQDDQSLSLHRHQSLDVRLHRQQTRPTCGSLSFQGWGVTLTHFPHAGSVTLSVNLRLYTLKSTLQMSPVRHHSLLSWSVEKTTARARQDDGGSLMGLRVEVVYSPGK